MNALFSGERRCASKAGELSSTTWHPNRSMFITVGDQTKPCPGIEERKTGKLHLLHGAAVPKKGVHVGHLLHRNLPQENNARTLLDSRSKAKRIVTPLTGRGNSYDVGAMGGGAYGQNSKRLVCHKIRCFIYVSQAGIHSVDGDSFMSF